MKTIARLLAVACALIFVSGCAIFGDQIETAAKAGGKLVNFYCENVTIPEIREQLREAVNRHAAPNSVVVTCASGGPALRSNEAPPGAMLKPTATDTTPNDS